jgi:glycosyltransferase involved in cell wall biosynthesis
MSDLPLVSIIIPTYNRAHLIGETLDSVIAQTYQNWECIIVDDGSTDNTDEVVEAYLSRDGRFSYHYRPKEHLSGGNGARNFGYKMSKGKYVNWFDSDDLMIPEKIELKVNALIENNVDFVVSKWAYFNEPPGTKSYDTQFAADEVDFVSFTTSHIYWGTPDFMVKSKVVKEVRFNEHLKSGQEYNFIAKMLLITDNVSVLDQVLVKRRYANDSIGVVRRKNKIAYFKSNFDHLWITFKEVYPLSGNNRKFGSKVLLKVIKAYLVVDDLKKPSGFDSEVIRFYGLRAIYFYMACLTSKLFNKYFFFYNKLKLKA